jgi:hypothetical protein
VQVKCQAVYDYGLERVLELKPKTSCLKVSSFGTDCQTSKLNQ